MGDVEKETAWDLLRLPEFGRKSLNEIEEWFAEHGRLAGQRRQDALRQMKAMRERAARLRKQADETDKHIAELQARLDGDG
jgi:hypothetical protein